MRAKDYSDYGLAQELLRARTHIPELMQEAADRLTVRATPQGAEPVAEGFMLPDGSICSTSATLGTLRVRDDDAASGCKIVSLYTHPPWMKHHDYHDHVVCIGGWGVSETPPYTHWMPLPPPPAELARQEGSAT